MLMNFPCFVCSFSEVPFLIKLIGCTSSHLMQQALHAVDSPNGLYLILQASVSDESPCFTLQWWAAGHQPEWAEAVC